MLFVLAIAIHNLPEGLAAGVVFGVGNNAEALIKEIVEDGGHFDAMTGGRVNSTELAAALINRKLLIPNYPEGCATSESLNVAIATAVVCAEFRRTASLK